MDRCSPLAPEGAEHGVHPGRKTWTELREDEAKTLGFTEQQIEAFEAAGVVGVRPRQEVMA